MYRCIFLIITTMMSIPSIIGQSAEISDKLKSNIQSRMDADEIKGLVIGTTRGGETSYYSKGTQSLESKEAIDEHTVFEIGSITKTFTGLMLSNMVVQGKMKLDDDIQKYLPDGIKAPTKNDQPIQLVHLANHTSGLPRMPSNFAPTDNSNPYKDYSQEKMYQFLNDYELTKEIGIVYEYSNLGAGLLGQILATHSKKTYEDLLVASIAEPLGMNHTSTQTQGPLAKGHMANNEMPNWDFASFEGAGAIRSTTSDMMRYLSANMGLTKSKLYPAMQLAHKNSGDADSKHKVGLGWHIMMYDDKEIIWHNGATGGYSSFTGWVTGTDIGVVVLNNSTENVDDIGLHALVPSFPLKEIKKTVEIDESILESYVGQYALAPTFILTVTRDGKQLSVGATGQSSFEIYPTSETAFFYKVVEAELVFKKDKNGMVQSVTLFQGGQEMPGKRID